MILRFLASLVLAHTAIAADLITVCGGEEVYQVDPKASPVTKLWSWRAKDRPELPEAIKGIFATTDECKAIDNGKRMLVCASSGGCALLEMPSGKALWWAKVTNAHSIEILPSGAIAVASSTGANGNKIVFFNASVPEKPVHEIPLPSAHGLVWDEERTGLWAIGFKELLFCQMKKGDPPLSFQVKARYPLPDEDGHDLRPVPHSPELILSTHAHVWRFHRDKGEFKPDSELKDRVETKSIDIHPKTGRIMLTQASGENWWTNFVELLNPAAKITLEREKIYKARWFITED
ncbi:DUF6528 family protein [Luteolibacter luteus]|uniref:WD40 repeat domain-containing protein n=1 Tax=Luteolibacter luteus TaxID=2728835 RepID=A0A858RLF8_9BACT|nr:DUF6528 family protein [Luteolibacter luteus]QJE97441.1 hypothetical protein HHL09_17165 [Luteolibacter luteus]